MPFDRAALEAELARVQRELSAYDSRDQVVARHQHRLCALVELGTRLRVVFHLASVDAAVDAARAATPPADVSLWDAGSLENDGYVIVDGKVVAEIEITGVPSDRAAPPVAPSSARRTS